MKANANLGKSAHLESVADVGRLKELNLQLSDALAKEKLRSDFVLHLVSTLAHDLRTPLTAIRTAASILRNYRERMSLEEQVKRLIKIEDLVEAMTETIEASGRLVQRYSRDSGDGRGVVELDLICHRAVERVSKARGKQSAVEVCLPEDSPTIEVDESLFELIVFKLLSAVVELSEQDESVALHIAMETGRLILTAGHLPARAESGKKVFDFRSVGEASSPGASMLNSLNFLLLLLAVESYGGELQSTAGREGQLVLIVALPFAETRSLRPRERL